MCSSGGLKFQLLQLFISRSHFIIIETAEQFASNGRILREFYFEFWESTLARRVSYRWFLQAAWLQKHFPRKATSQYDGAQDYWLFRPILACVLVSSLAAETGFHLTFYAWGTCRSVCYDKKRLYRASIVKLIRILTLENRLDTLNTARPSPFSVNALKSSFLRAPMFWRSILSSSLELYFTVIHEYKTWSWLPD